MQGACRFVILQSTWTSYRYGICVSRSKYLPEITDMGFKYEEIFTVWRQCYNYAYNVPNNSSSYRPSSTTLRINLTSPKQPPVTVKASTTKIPTTQKSTTPLIPYEPIVPARRTTSAPAFISSSPTTTTHPPNHHLQTGQINVTVIILTGLFCNIIPWFLN